MSSRLWEGGWSIQAVEWSVIGMGLVGLEEGVGTMYVGLRLAGGDIYGSDSGWLGDGFMEVFIGRE